MTPGASPAGLPRVFMFGVVEAVTAHLASQGMAAATVATVGDAVARVLGRVRVGHRPPPRGPVSSPNGHPR
jgi:hypothetical protein